MNATLVIVDKCFSLGSFDNKKALLESNGIQVYSDSETTVTVCPWYANAIGGIKLRVSQSDASRAKEILESINSVSVEPEMYKAKKKAAAKSLFIALVTGGVFGSTFGYINKSLATGVEVFLLLAFITYVYTAYVLIKKRT